MTNPTPDPAASPQNPRPGGGVRAGVPEDGITEGTHRVSRPTPVRLVVLWVLGWREVLDEPEEQISKLAFAQPLGPGRGVLLVMALGHLGFSRRNLGRWL